MTDEEHTPKPDPTTLTTEQLIRTIEAERQLSDAHRARIVQRLDGIDRATELLNDDLNRVPTDTQIAVRHLRELHEEMFKAVDQRFDANDKAIATAQRNTEAALEKLAVLFKSTTDPIERQVTDLKEGLQRIQNIKTGGQQAYLGIYAMVGLVVSLLSIAGTVAALR